MAPGGCGAPAIATAVVLALLVPALVINGEDAPWFDRVGGLVAPAWVPDGGDPGALKRIGGLPVPMLATTGDRVAV